MEQAYNGEVQVKMPLQWLPLQQRQQQQPQRSAVSEALTPQRKGFAEAGGTMPNRFVEEQKAIWAEEDKLKKLERDSQTQRAQEIGMRTMGQAQQQQQQQQQQGAAKQQIEANPEPAAKEMYELLKTMPPETQNVLLNQIFTPTAPSGTISSAGKTVTTPEKYNPIADVFMSKGWATIGEGGKPVLSEPEREFEKGTFKEMSDGDIINEATGEIIAKGSEIPTDWGIVYTETLDEGLKYVKEMYDASWMETMDTDEMIKHSERKQAAYRDKIASLLYSKGMRDKAEINKLADLAVASYDWQKEIDDAKKQQGGETTTNRGLPLNEEVVAALKRLLKANPEEINNLDVYRDEHGDASVDAALKEETVPPTTTTTLRKKKEEYGKYKAL